MKPRQKVVTAEDISSSLYYLHVDSEDDVADTSSQDLDLNGHLEAMKASGRDHQVVHRKPLPGRESNTLMMLPTDSANVNPNGRYMSPESVHHSRLMSEGHISTGEQRKTVAGRSTMPPSAPPELPPRKPLGPRSAGRSRSPPKRLHGLENVPAQTYHQHSGLPRSYIPDGLGPLSSQLPTLREDDLAPRETELVGNKLSQEPSSQDGTFFLPSGPRGNAYVSPSRERPPPLPRRLPSGVPIPTSFEQRRMISPSSFTLIRRDPASAAQWNVAKLSSSSISSRPPSGDFSVNPIEADSQDRIPMLEVEILTPGYSRFLGASTRPNTSDSHVLPSLPTQGSLAEPAQLPQRDRSFCRQLWVEGSSLWDRSFHHRRFASTDSSKSTSTRGSSLDLTLHHGRHGSSVDYTNGTRKPKPRKYFFLSPWEGRCEFTSSGGGRTMTCKHSLPISNQISSWESAVTISELRFNLPQAIINSASLSSLSPSYSLDSTRSKRSSLFASSCASSSSTSTLRSILNPHLTSQSSQSSSPLDSHPPVTHPSLPGPHLGREKAGGGNRGKRAKLGKLIVHDEGLRMLDLLVAVNLGVWWRAWERGSGGGGGGAEG
ncbi:MAG: hypothetical protein M1817_004238 [Caeruleum heppii]|nr:MAG: hypothetical protein M1817_004238 [Caeruleum heppii]